MEASSYIGQSVVPNTARHCSRLIFVGYPSLHTEILIDFLAQSLKTKSTLLKPEYINHEATNSAIVLLDCGTIGSTRLPTCLRELYRQAPNAPVALLNVGDCSYEHLITWPSVKGLFYENCSRELLIKGLTAIRTGENWLPRHILNEAFENQRKRLPPPTESTAQLSKREQQILGLITSGTTNAEVANTLHISEHTVKSHLYNIFRKIGVRNRMEASHWCSIRPELSQ